MFEGDFENEKSKSPESVDKNPHHPQRKTRLSLLTTPSLRDEVVSSERRVRWVVLVVSREKRVWEG